MEIKSIVTKILFTVGFFTFGIGGWYWTYRLTGDPLVLAVEGFLAGLSVGAFLLLVLSAIWFSEI